MKRNTKRVLLISLSSLIALVIALFIHIYLVTQPKPDEHTLAMARIDLEQDITVQDAATITAWLYKQQGVNHVLCNPGAGNVVFTFYPAKVNANQLTNEMKATLHYKAMRYLPDAAAMRKGCPLSPNSMTYRIAAFFRN